MRTALVLCLALVGCGDCPVGGGVHGPYIIVNGGLNEGVCHPSIYIQPFHENFDCFYDGEACGCRGSRFAHEDEGKYDFTVTMDGVVSSPQEAEVWAGPGGCGNKSVPRSGTQAP